MAESPSQEQAPVEATAALCVWRIFGLTRDWDDRPQQERSRQWKVSAGPSEGDQLSLTIGEIPTYIFDGIRDWRAQLPYGLDRLTGRYADYSSAQIDELIQSFREKVSIEDVTGDSPLWLTMELRRPITVRADPDAHFAWVRGDPIDVEPVQKFGEDAADYLDGAIVRLLPTLGAELGPQRLLFSERRPYVLLEGKGAWTLPRLSGGFAAAGYVTTGGSDRLPFDSIGAALTQLPTGGKAPLAKRLRSVRWLWTALEQSSDNLRRFLFAFFGLEILANQVGQKLRQQVIDSLGAELDGAPVGELMWPVLRDDEAPYRNLVFRFACLALILSRQSAGEDVALFKRLARVRNDFAHGGAEEINGLPAGEAFDLLQRYLSLVAEAEAQGALPQ